MSEFKCLEPDCEYHIGLGGPVVTDEDFEQQEYYFQEIEEHQQMHEALKLETKGGDSGMSESKCQVARVQELLLNDDVMLVESDNLTGTVILNPRSTYLYSVTVDRDLPVAFKICPVIPERGFVRVDYRIETVLEENIRLVVQPEAVHPATSILERFNVKVEGPIFGELLENERFQGCQLFIIKIDDNSFPANGVNEFPHESSLSVGVPNGTVGGTSESTERDQTPDVGEKKKHPAVTAAGCGEIKTNR